MKNALSLLNLVTISENEYKNKKITKQDDVFSAIEKKYGWDK